MAHKGGEHMKTEHPFLHAVLTLLASAAIVGTVLVFAHSGYVAYLHGVLLNGGAR